MTTALTIDIDVARGRIASGEKLTDVAAGLGLPWQRLSKALRGKARGGPAPSAAHPNPKTEIADGANEPPRPIREVPRQALTERLRPRRLADVAGQETAIALLRAFAASPYPAAFVLAGDTGTGKTSAAVALAGELGCDVAAGEYGGVHVVASGEQTADNVREALDRLTYSSWSGSGWKVLIVNEADRMCRPAETIWLDRLESIPAKSVIIFTTNEPERLAPRFMDRCTVLQFESRADVVKLEAMRFIASIWKRETGRDLPKCEAAALFDSCVNDGQFSFRRAVVRLQGTLLRSNGKAGN